ncbi:MAG: PfkB family carbohydrate kinase [Candidatus Nanopelagicales bacterium]
MARHVAACGLTTLDLVQYVDRLPGPDEKVQALEARIEFGGPAANAAFAAGALGVPSRLITCIGRSALSRAVLESVVATGIEVADAAAHRDWQPPVSSVAVTGGHRSVISLNASGSPASALPAGALDDCTALLVDGHHLALAMAAATHARLAGIPVLLDGGSWKPGLENLIPLVDAAVLSADFDPPDPPAWHGRPVAVTDGPHAIHFWVGQAEGSVPVEAIPTPDTLGAGDVFHGAWLAHVGRFGLHDFEAGLRFAARIASLSCRHPGAHAWAEHL